jgi:hypothetical protein
MADTERFELTVDMSNAAFEEQPAAELAGILRGIARSVERGWCGGPIHDSNGNEVGSFRVVVNEGE